MAHICKTDLVESILQNAEPSSPQHAKSRWYHFRIRVILEGVPGQDGVAEDDKNCSEWRPWLDHSTDRQHYLWFLQITINLFNPSTASVIFNCLLKYDMDDMFTVAQTMLQILCLLANYVCPGLKKKSKINRIFPDFMKGTNKRLHCTMLEGRRNTAWKIYRLIPPPTCLMPSFLRPFHCANP